MCDGILVLIYKEKPYWFVIEQKTSNPDKYKKQLINGKCFCDWLIALYRSHGYLSDDPAIIISLLVWEGREKNVSKGLTSHRDNPTIEETQVGLFEHSFDVKGSDMPVPILEIIRRALKRSGSGR